jgi:predicted HNH restriction endonuclease
LNALLRREHLDPASVKLVRHCDTRQARSTAHDLWLAGDKQFKLYQQIQRRPVFNDARSIASFVVTPSKETLFVGIFSIVDVGKAPPGLTDPSTGKDVNTEYFYELEPAQPLSELRGRLIIDWGKGNRAWVQRAHKQDKTVIAIRDKEQLTEPGKPHLAHSGSVQGQDKIRREQELRDFYAEPRTRNPKWTRDELILALDMYLRYAGTPPGKGSPEIAELSETLNRLARYLGLTRGDRFRNINGAYMKLMNFRRFDPAFTKAGKVGLERGGKDEEEVWKEFATDLKRCGEVAAVIRQTLATADEGETIANLASDEAEGLEEAEEGRVITAIHRRYERDVRLVKRKKAGVLATTGRLECEACGFSFQSRYGARGEGFIECHHTRPVHQLKPGDKTRINDLRLLCSNCHRMIHAKRPWLTMDELLKSLRSVAPA